MAGIYSELSSHYPILII